MRLRGLSRLRKLWRRLRRSIVPQRGAIILDLLTPLLPEQREAVLQQLRLWFGVSENGRPEYRLMTVDELVAISRDGLVDIGAHTVNHPDLTAIPPEQQRWEIETSKRQLEEWLGRPVR